MAFYNGHERKTQADEMNAPTLSMIVPLAEDEPLWRDFLTRLPTDADGEPSTESTAPDEILFAAPTPPPDDWAQLSPPAAKWLRCENRGRAAQMNAAAAESCGEFLWFVHADSRLPADGAARLRKSLAAAADAVHYFDLRFYDGGRKMRVNEWGARLRCALFRNPFGDQALAMSRRTFTALGGFDESAAYGEDHLLALAARRNKTPLRRVGAQVGTSARRYRKNGWWKTVFLFQRLWFRQWRRR